MYGIIKKILIAVTVLVIAVLGEACSTSRSSSSDTFDPALDTCQSDSDCVLAIDVNVCCSCPMVMTQARVKETKGVETYVPGVEYGSFRPIWCIWATCSPCSVPPAGAICISGKCQAPQTAQQILDTCPSCFVQAAQTVFQSGNLSEAVNFCTLAASNQQYNCFSELFNSALTTNRLNEAEQLCREYLNQDIGDCLRLIAQKVAGIDHQRALVLCSELDPNDARHFGCVLDVALAIRSQNQNLALEICTRLPTDEAELCHQEISKQ